jgi:hypothetical protein
MSLGTFKGQVAGPGFGHFSKCRPKFYQNVLDLSGLSLHQGTINVKSTESCLASHAGDAESSWARPD